MMPLHTEQVSGASGRARTTNRNGATAMSAGNKLFVFLLTMLLAATSAAAEGPRPPCGNSPLPAYPPSSGPPVVLSETVTSWVPPACLGWDGRAPGLLVVIVGRMRETGGATALLTRFGSVSQLRGVRYWSVTDRGWRTLITDAFAVSDAVGRRRRNDFRAEEMLPGIPLYMSEGDSRSSGPVIYRMRILSHTAGRVVVSVSNASSMRASMITLFAPGELQTTYFLDQLAPDDWGYYAISGATTGLLTGGHVASFVNRAVGFYRYFVGIPTDQDPPVAR